VSKLKKSRLKNKNILLKRNKSKMKLKDNSMILLKGTKF